MKKLLLSVVAIATLSTAVFGAEIINKQINMILTGDNGKAIILLRTTKEKGIEIKFKGSKKGEIIAAKIDGLGADEFYKAIFIENDEEKAFDIAKKYGTTQTSNDIYAGSEYKK